MTGRTSFRTDVAPDWPKQNEQPLRLDEKRRTTGLSGLKQVFFEEQDRHESGVQRREKRCPGRDLARKIRIKNTALSIKNTII